MLADEKLPGNTRTVQLHNDIEDGARRVNRLRQFAATRESGEELHLFLPQNPGEDFTWMGRLEAESVVFKSDEPSRFVCRLLNAG